MTRVIQILFCILPVFGFSQTDTIVHLYAFGGNNNDSAEEIEATTDGGYVVIGATSSNSWGNTDGYLLKVDSLCNYQWSIALGGANNDWGYSIKQTFDKGFIIASTSNSYGNGGYDAVLMKRDSMGNYEWRKVYGGPDWDFAYSVVQTYDSGYVFCGETYNNSNGYSDVFIVKTNRLGDTLWTRTYGGALIDKGNSIIETSDSNIVVAGITNTLTDSTDIYVIKLTPNGTLIWDSIYSSLKYQRANQIIEASNGNYVMVGTTTGVSVGGDQDYLIKGVSSNGNSLWIQEFPNGPGPTPDDEDAYAIHELPNNNLLISGYSKTGGNNKNIIFYQLQANGNWAGVSAVVSTSNDDFVKSVAIGSNGNILGAGSTYSIGVGVEDLLLVRLDTIYSGQDTSISSYYDVTPLNTEQEEILNKVSIYPNPVYSTFYISSTKNLKVSEVQIFDVAGKMVYAKKVKNSRIDISQLKDGIYIVQVVSESYAKFQTKIIKY